MPIKTLFAAALMTLAAQCNVQADEGAHRLFGLFCNSEEQLDETLAHMGRNLTPRAAVELTNNGGIVCNYVDEVQYVVDNPLIIGQVPGVVPLIKYEARLIGVVVGRKLRAVEPPVRIFFVAPQRLAGAAMEERA